MDYWQKRIKEAQEKKTEKSIEETQKQLRFYYIKAMKSVIGAFEATYDKLIATVADGEAPTPADLYKLDKYWALQGQLRSELQSLGDKQIVELSKQFESQYKGVYEALALGSQKAFSTMSKEGATQLINQIWCADGKSWSQRIWTNTDKLQQALNDRLIECVISGKTTGQLKKTLQDEFGVSYNRADTIVRTEMAHIQTQASRQRYQEYGITEIEIFADTDNRTCPICSKLDGKRFGINDALPIPAHPRCRCCALPVLGDEDIKAEKEKFFTPKDEPTIIESKKPALSPAKDKNKGSSDEEKLNLITSKFSKYGTAILPKGVKITHGGKHADKRLEKRGITVEDAQHYIDTAYICFQQSADKVMYLSEDGVAVVLGNGGLATAYPKSWFDETIQKLLKEVKNYGRSKEMGVPFLS